MSHGPGRAGLLGRAAWGDGDVLLWDVLNLEYFKVFRRETCLLLSPFFS